MAAMEIQATGYPRYPVLADGTIVRSLRTDAEPVEITSDGNLGVRASFCREFTVGPIRFFLNGESVSKQRFDEALTSFREL